ncbi:protocadherin-12 isoform X2 [Erpetoichthys calabaricus]|uniref:protocadherin-12 isoform X2 n=1 Tax=Erpetoichthys calabaricus TaxID=27687 RepID=UPI002234C9C0|nr:protocadherin-12 isoform X2 [Erpetoichthys calabaricus]
MQLRKTRAAELSLFLLGCLCARSLSNSATVFSAAYRVNEEVSSGTVVGKLEDVLSLERQNGPAMKFQVSSDTGAIPFQVSESDGAVSTLGRLDREALCTNDATCVIKFNVFYQRGFTFGVFHIQVEVLDINDNSPTFESQEQQIEISESANLRTRIPLDRALDPDWGPNGLQTYSLSANPHFALDVITGSGGEKHAELVVIKELDRELQSSFKLFLTAWDKGNPPKSGTTLVRVNVLDSNDNSPIFEDNLLTAELREDAQKGTMVISLKATDPDQGANGEVEYSFSKHAPQEVFNLFHIDAKTGIVTLCGVLDYEKKQAYEIDIQAKDLGPSPIPSHCKLNIKVLDVNDNIPVIHLSWVSSSMDVAVIPENAALESFLALMVVSDADSGENGNVQCEIHHGLGHFRLQKTHGDNYMIVTNASLDREKLDWYNLTLVAKDNGTPSFSASKHLAVHVADENDNAPVFSSNFYMVSLKENNQRGIQVINMKASDADLGMAGTITYSIKEPGLSPAFAVHPSNGTVIAQKPVDFEERQNFTLIIEGIDKGNPPLSSSATLFIRVQDINDNYPIIVDPSPKNGVATVSVPINTDTGEIVSELDGDHLRNCVPPKLADCVKADGYPAARIRATDLDSGINGELRYRMKSQSDSSIFTINEITGQIFVNSSNTTELLGKVYLLDVTVTDMGSPALTTTVVLQMTFLSLADHLKNSSSGGRHQLSVTMIVLICTIAGLLLVLLIAAGLSTLCHTEKRRDNRAYNCRQAESTYTRHPRRPQKQIHKADIHLVPVLRGRPAESSDGGIGQALPGPSDDTMDVPSPSPPCQFNLSPSLSRTLRNQTFPDPNDTLTSCRTLRKVDNESLLFTPSGSCKTLRKPKDINLHNTEDSMPVHADSSTMKMSGSAGKQDPSSPVLYRTLRRQKNTESKAQAENEDQQRILQNLFRLSMAALAEYNPTEVTAASSQVQISQLLSLLHKGQFQPRPNFRGNKYSGRTGRSGGQDADWLSTKDSGHGESEAGDVDWETGRDSPTDPLLAEGMETLPHPTDDVFVDLPDPAWMARLSLPLTADYRENIFVPQEPLSLAAPAVPIPADGTTVFSTFGKSHTASPTLTGNLLSEVSTLFEMLLSQKAESQCQPSAEVLYRLSAAYRRSLEGEDKVTGGTGGYRDSGEA